MKKFIMMFVVAMMTMTSVFAQADKIVGNYSAERGGVKSKVKVFKYNDGYRAQVT